MYHRIHAVVVREIHKLRKIQLDYRPRLTGDRLVWVGIQQFKQFFVLGIFLKFIEFRNELLSRHRIADLILLGSRKATMRD